jgi:hypothetical protein
MQEHFLHLIKYLTFYALHCLQVQPCIEMSDKKKINLPSQPLGADQAVYAHTVKAQPPSLSIGKVLIYSPRC